MSEENSTFEENNSSLPELSIDLLRLLDHHLFSDAVLKCNSVEIPVHKCILSARSPVFSAMFQSEMQEGQSGNVNIVDIKIDVLQVMLKYMYSGKTGNLSDEIAGDLLVAADKYGLEDLKRICSNKLKSIISADNVFNILVLGELHDSALKVHATKQICKYEFSDLEDTDAWKSLQDEYPKLAMDVMKSIVRYVQGSSNQREENSYVIGVRYGEKSEKTILLDVKATDTIQNVKKKIKGTHGIQSLGHRLFLGPQQLQDSRTLSHYDIQRDSVLILMGPKKIFVRGLSGKTHTLTVEKNTTTNLLRRMIEDGHF